MAIGSTIYGDTNINNDIITNVRDQVINELLNLDVYVKKYNNSDDKLEFDNIKYFEDLDDTSYIKADVNSDQISIIKTIVHYIVKIVYEKLVENVEIVSKDRIDNYGTEIDNVIIALDSLAASLASTGTIPVTGTTLAASLTTLSTAMKVGQTTRNTLLVTENLKGTDIT